MTLKTFGLAVALVLASAMPAMAQSMCSEPIPPAAVDGNVATKAQMNAAHDDVMSFLKQSDDYQVCLLKELADAKLQASHDKKDLDPAIPAAVNARIQANQRVKEKVGGEYNAAVMAYKARGPG